MAKKKRKKRNVRQGGYVWSRSFGRRLRELREASEMSQADLARRASLHPTYIGSIERGEKSPTLTVIEDLAGALGCQPIELFLPPQTVPKPGSRPKKEDLEAKFQSLFRRADSATYWMIQAAFETIGQYQIRRR